MGKTMYRLWVEDEQVADVMLSKDDLSDLYDEYIEEGYDINDIVIEELTIH